MNKNTFLLLVGIAIVPAGCTMAPKYTRPKAPVPADWPTGTAYQGIQPATNAPDARQLRWREFFTDEKLQQVIAAALTNNRDLRVAALNVELARAQYGIQRAELLPTVNATGSELKQRIPAYVEGFPEPMTIKNYGVNLGVASWEIDFFGRIRSLKDQALAGILCHGAGPPQRADTAGVFGGQRVSDPGCGSGEPGPGGNHSCGTAGHLQHDQAAP